MAQAIFEVVAPSDVEDPRATRDCGTAEALCDLVTATMLAPLDWTNHEPTIVDANNHGPPIETIVGWTH
eukprot:Skav230721  [mRNA]  locus=scaffold715:323522:323728:- [translate_table: standard]